MPPFCMCLIFDNPAPVIQNIYSDISVEHSSIGEQLCLTYANHDAVWDESFERDTHCSGFIVARV